MLLYRVTAKLGRTFAELEPYPLYPLSDYFYGEHRETFRSTDSDSPRERAERKGASP